VSNEVFFTHPEDFGIGCQIPGGFMLLHSHSIGWGQATLGDQVKEALEMIGDFEILIPV
jgi:hypothetical protein